jgi:hypothetical protein
MGDGDQAESMAAFMARRRRYVANVAAGAQAAAHRAYGDAIRTGQDLNLSQPSDVLNFGARLVGGATPGQGSYFSGPDHFGGGFELQDRTEGQADAVPAPGSLQARSASAAQPAPPSGQPHSNHPGFAESLIPVWGSGREAVADFQDGNIWGGAFNTALAASDLFLAGDVAKAVAKGGFYALKGPIGEAAAAQTWKRVSAKMRDEGMLEAGQHGHHWFVPQKGWGKIVPDVIKNHPINIMAMPDTATHMRITGRYKGLPRFNPFERYWYGTPTWSKVATVDAVGHPIAAATAGDHGQ